MHTIATAMTIIIIRLSPLDSVTWRGTTKVAAPNELTVSNVMLQVPRLVIVMSALNT